MILEFHIKIDFQLPGSLTDDSTTLDTVQLPVKRTSYFLMCLRMVATGNESMHPNISLLIK